jgi:hypothetical protein
MKTPLLRHTALEGPAREFHLQPGVNTFGRLQTNRHAIDSASVSGRHCEVVWDDEAILVRDLGSTNGTFIDDRRIAESRLHHGQTLRLGSVDLVLRVAGEESSPPAPGPARLGTPPLARPMPTATAPRPASFPAVVLVPLGAPPRSFFQRLPGSFTYPFSTNGILLLIGGTILYSVLGFVSMFSVIVSVVATGYLFAYMQRIIAVSAQGEEELPDWPELSEWWADILRPFLLLLWTGLVCFGPVWALFQLRDRADPLGAAGVWTLLGVGGLYFPMALLATAATDNFLAVNPMVIIPSILRVLGPYLVACGLLGLLVALRWAGELLAELIPVPLLPALLREFVSLYLLCVEMRILGLLYHTHRERLGWFA